MKISRPKKITFYLFFILITVYFLLFPAPLVQAQSTITLTAIPPRLELTAKPGEVVQETIKIRNDTNTELVTQTTVKDFIVVDDYGTPMPVNEQVSGRWSLASWINLSPTKNILKSKDTTLISLVISVPSDALPGGHYAMILHEPISGVLIGGSSGSSISQKVGTLVYLNVAGPVSEQANLTRFEVDKKFSEYGPVNFITEIRNLSDTHIKPQGAITVYNMLNKVSKQLTLEEVNIFPLKSRIFEAQFPDKWHFGRYKAIFNATYGSKNNKLAGMLYFWIIPWKIILILLLILLLLLLTILYLKKRSKAKKETGQINQPSNTPPSIEIPGNKSL